MFVDQTSDIYQYSNMENLLDSDAIYFNHVNI